MATSRTSFQDLPPPALAAIARCLSKRYEVPCSRKWQDRGVWSPVHAFAAASKACRAAVASSGLELVLTSGAAPWLLRRDAALRSMLTATQKLSIHSDASANLVNAAWGELADLLEQAQPRFTALYLGGAGSSHADRVCMTMQRSLILATSCAVSPSSAPRVCTGMPYRCKARQCAMHHSLLAAQVSACLSSPYVPSLRHVG